MGQLVRLCRYIVRLVVIILDHRQASNYLLTVSEKPQPCDPRLVAGYDISAVPRLEPLVYILPAVDTVVVHLDQRDVLLHKYICHAAACVITPVPQVGRRKPLLDPIIPVGFLDPHGGIRCNQP